MFNLHIYIYIYIYIYNHALVLKNVGNDSISFGTSRNIIPWGWGKVEDNKKGMKNKMDLEYLKSYVPYLGKICFQFYLNLFSVTELLSLLKEMNYNNRISGNQHDHRCS
jgi:hypothetical protein